MSLPQDHLQAKRVELILQQLEQLPTLPAVAMQVIHATADDQSSASDVISLISSDVSLTARVLQLVRRADLGVRSEVNTVERAVVLLGFEAIRSAVLALSIFESFSQPSGPNHVFSREEFWKHSLAVACCAEVLAEAKGDVAGREGSLGSAEAFVCGLLHDLGKVALDAILPKSFARVVEAAELLRGNIADIERSIIGLDHLVVGKRLAERWDLPLVIRECIWLHGQLPEALPPTVKFPRMVNLVTLADLIVREQHLGYSGNYQFNIGRDRLIAAIGLTRETADAAIQKLVERIESRAHALQLSQASTQELYQQALARANQELGRVSGQLAQKNRRLAVRAKFFDALSTFQSELRPDSPPQIVLQAIGQTAASVLGGSSVGAFSLMPTQDFAEVLLFDAQGDVFDTTLVDCDKRPSARETGEGPVLRAGDELDWLLAAISPRLSGDHRFWISLEAEGACVGGVVWGAAPGESQRLSPQIQELSAIAGGWALALRTAQIREEAKALAEQLAETNRRLQSAQSEVLRSKMMTTVGEMAAGAAHEMNNPLAVISGRSQLLAAQLADPKHKAMAHLIHDQSHRLSEIITELMDFASPVPPQPSECDPADLVDRAMHDAKQHTDPADRTIEITMGDVPMVWVDAMQVSAALTEVIDNALLATEPSGGQITVHGAFDPHSSRVAITIADNGCGMEEETLRRAFDPFFSNKPAGRRRGMGLPKALRWIESSGGSMRLESRPQQGTRTLILLPATPPAIAQASEAQRKAAT
ncbi:MAG: HDOD domain-containing protein [Planctomycetota bacterium]|nr:HDOD domain-containing protein [Planctomycetota bacterium]